MPVYTSCVDSIWIGHIDGEAFNVNAIELASDPKRQQSARLLTTASPCFGEQL